MTTKVGNSIRRIYNSIADMKKDPSIKEGDYVKTLGYSTSNDGGGGEYVAGSSFGVDNASTIHDLDNGLQVKLIETTFINSKVLGGSSDESGLGVIGCAVRLTPQPDGVDNTFAFVDDSEHDVINCTTVTGGLNSVTVNHDQPAGSQVVGSAVAVPDETLAERGITVGGSIGTEVSAITMGKRHQFIANWEAGAVDPNNLIEDPFMDSTRYVVTNNIGVDGSFQIVHPRTLDGYALTLPQSSVSPDTIITSVSDTTIKALPYKDITITCEYDGANWTVSAGQSVLTTALAAIGVTCSSAGNIITVSYPPTLGTTPQAVATLQPSATYGSVNVFGTNNTQTQLVFVQGSTDAPRAPVAGDKFNLYLEKIQWLYGKSIIDIGHVRLSPTLDFKNIPTSNNFWLLGNHWALK